MASPINTSTNTGSQALSDGGTIDFANLGPYLLTKFLLVLEAALIIIVGLFLIRYIKRYLGKLVTEHAQQKTAINLFEKLISGFLIVISVTLALRTVGIDMTLLVSVSILGLSYGLQDIIKNYVAGILIMFKSPFQIGDIIKIKGETGRVETIDFQSTTLRSFDQKRITIYNSDVMTQSIANITPPPASPIRRISIDVTVGYGTDATKTFKILDKIFSNYPSILKKPGHKIVFNKFTDTGISFSARGWIKLPANLLAIRSDLGLQISQAFNEEDIFMPYTKDIQFEADYTMTEARKARQAEFTKNPTLQIEPNAPLGEESELIDYEELD